MKTQFLLSDGWTPEERLKEELDPFPAYSEDVQIKMVKSKGEEQQEIGLSLLNNLLEEVLLGDTDVVFKQKTEKLE